MFRILENLLDDDAKSWRKEFAKQDAVTIRVKADFREETEEFVIQATSTTSVHDCDEDSYRRPYFWRSLC